jgi:hypothetical protein
MMKIYLPILASAALLTGCGQNTDVADTRVEEPYVTTAPVIVTDQESGTFTVDARSDPGATFQNGSSGEVTFEFIAKGEWSFAADAGMLGPSGADAPAGPNYLLPKARSFGMVAKLDDGNVEFAGDRYRARLKPKESISFSMNDVSGSFGDNRGSLTVRWSKELTN